MSTYITIPDFVERKGSLFLRSDHMNYSRATLNSNWHQARESEPKDYDMNKDDVRDLCKATYKRIGNVTDGDYPNTTYQDFADQINLKEDFTEQEKSKPMINCNTTVHLDRETGTPNKGYGSTLPGNHPGHDKSYFDTTHRTDYKSPFPYTPIDVNQEKPQAEELPDHSSAYKRCHSQFADTADHRRSGRNTWQDESGVYTNSHFKAECPTYQRTNPFKGMEGMQYDF